MKNVTINWVPRHVGIYENERADRAAKEVAMRTAEFVPIPYGDWFPLIKGNYLLPLELNMEGQGERTWNYEGETRKMETENDET